MFLFQAAKLQAKLSGEQAEPSKIQRLNSIPCQCDTNSSSSSSNSQTEQMVRDLLRDMVDDALNRVLQTSEPSNPASSGTSEPSYPASTALVCSIFKNIYIGLNSKWPFQCTKLTILR